MEITKSIGFPANDNDWVKKCLIGGHIVNNTNSQFRLYWLLFESDKMEY